jgi:hypothetical protein
LVIVADRGAGGASGTRGRDGVEGERQRGVVAEASPSGDGVVAEAGVTSGAVGVTVVVEDDVIMNDVIMICGPPFVEYDVARYNER